MKLNLHIVNSLKNITQTTKKLVMKRSLKKCKKHTIFYTMIKSVLLMTNLAMPLSNKLVVAQRVVIHLVVASLDLARIST